MSSSRASDASSKAPKAAAAAASLSAAPSSPAPDGPTLAEVLLEELGKMGIVVGLWYLVIARKDHDTALSLHNSILPRLLHDYLPVRFLVGVALHAVRATFSWSAGRGQELLVLLAVCAAYVFTAHVVPGVDVSGPAKSALGAHAGALVKAVASTLRVELTSTLYYASFILVLIIGGQLFCGGRRGARS